MNTCPKCGFTSESGIRECPKCGIIVEKFLKMQQCQKKRQQTWPSDPPESDEAGAAEGWMAVIKESIFHVKPDINPFYFGGRVLLFVVLLVTGLKFILTPADEYAGESCFWHLVNLPFHEAGHIFFRPFGRFITSLGGTLGQLLMPLICMLTFIIKTRDAFGASLAMWWLGENFMDIAPYINDARAGIMPLLGGNTGQTSPYGFHDWEFILTETGLIMHDHTIAGLSKTIGAAIMLLSFAWGGFILFKQCKNLDFK